MQLGEKEIRALVSLIGDDDQEVLDHVEAQIRALGDKAIPFLETEWEQNIQPTVQKRIEDIIHNLQYEQLAARLKAWADEGAEDLLYGMWLVATYQYPDLDMAKLRKTMDQLYYDTWLELRPDLNPIDQITVINDVLFRKMKFTANTKNFHSPGNSMINVVLESKRGNPISLCVVYMLICQKMKMPVYGVNMPNLFLLTYKDDAMQFYINAFSKGLTLTRKDIDNYLASLNLSPLNVFYEPCGHLDIVRRTLRNLIVSFEKASEDQKVQEVKRLLSSISPDEEEESN
jgi:regulator of sirC expression with transglutaminase-like and TPR domain